jgi:hypothetical protein
MLTLIIPVETNRYIDHEDYGPAFEDLAQQYVKLEEEQQRRKEEEKRFQQEQTASQQQAASQQTPEAAAVARAIARKGEKSGFH